MMEARWKGWNLEKYHGREIKRNGWHDSLTPASFIGLIAEIDVHERVFVWIHVTPVCGAFSVL